MSSPPWPELLLVVATVVPPPLPVVDELMPRLDMADLQKALIEEGRKYGLNNFLLKPFTNDGLRNCLERVVGKLS